MQDVLNNLNSISEKLFKSIENEVYKILDNIVYISEDILKKEPLKNIFFENEINGIIIIAISLILFYIIYYILNQLITLYNGKDIENIYHFVLKIIIVSILVNSSFFICEQILNFFYLLTEAVGNFGEEISGYEITFETLKEEITSIEQILNIDFLSLDGIVKSMICFGVISILINFSIRYVTVIFLVIISPFAVISLTSDLTVGIFKTWIKTLVINLIIQIFVKIIIIIPIMYKDTKDIMYKIILIGSLYLIFKVNNFAKELFIKISEK